MFALRDVTRAESIVGSFPFVQAPMWPGRPAGSSLVSPCSYPEIMQQYGYAEREGLLAMVKAWRQIFEWTAADAVVFDHAPTALLAARGRRLVRALYGVGFSSPPRRSPLPSFRVWQDVPVQRLQSSESLVLSTVNWVLGKLHEEPVAALHELFAVDDDFLCTFPELDHYRDRQEGHYCGPVFHAEHASVPEWPSAGTRKVCIYIRPEMRSFESMVRALRSSPYAVLWIAPGADMSDMRRYETQRLSFSNKPVQLTRAASEADAAVLYGSHGTAAAMLLAGVPLVLSPNHVEQMLVARNIARLGACSLVSPAATVDEIRSSVECVVEEPRYKQAATAFGAKYASFDPRSVVDRVAARISSRCVVQA